MKGKKYNSGQTFPASTKFVLNQSPCCTKSVSLKSQSCDMIRFSLHHQFSSKAEDHFSPHLFALHFSTKTSRFYRCTFRLSCIYKLTLLQFNFETWSENRQEVGTESLCSRLFLCKNKSSNLTLIKINKEKQKKNNIPSKHASRNVVLPVFRSWKVQEMLPIMS